MSPVAPGIYARRDSSSSDTPGIYAVRHSRRPSAAAVAPTPSRQEPQQEKQLQQGAAPRGSAGLSYAFAAGVAAGKAITAAAAAASQTPPMTPDSLGAEGSLFAATAAETTSRSRSRSHSVSRSWSSSMCRRYREVTDADIAECFSPAFSMYTRGDSAQGVPRNFLKVHSCKRNCCKHSCKLNCKDNSRK